jgi:hypothetical protein
MHINLLFVDTYSSIQAFFPSRVFYTRFVLDTLHPPQVSLQVVMASEQAPVEPQVSPTDTSEEVQDLGPESTEQTPATVPSTQSTQDTPETAPSAEDTPETAPSAEETPETAPSAEDTPETAPSAEDTPETAPSTEKTPETAPSAEETTETEPTTAPDSTIADEEAPAKPSTKEKISGILHQTGDKIKGTVAGVKTKMNPKK